MVKVKLLQSLRTVPTTQALLHSAVSPNQFLVQHLPSNEPCPAWAYRGSNKRLEKLHGSFIIHNLFQTMVGSSARKRRGQPRSIHRRKTNVHILLGKLEENCPHETPGSGESTVGYLWPPNGAAAQGAKIWGASEMQVQQKIYLANLDLQSTC